MEFEKSRLGNEPAQRAMTREDRSRPGVTATPQASAGVNRSNTKSPTMVTLTVGHDTGTTSKHFQSLLRRPLLPPLPLAGEGRGGGSMTV
jgi:hypothetical protein